MFCWGNSTHNELCIESSNNLDLVIRPTLSKWKDAIHIRSIAASECHALYLTNQGNLYSCGNNDVGQLGRIRDKTQNTNKPVAGVETFKGCIISAVACGSQHSMALDEWGQPFSWGADSMGQLGSNLGHDMQSKPRIIKFLATKNIVQIACGEHHSLVLSNNGEMYSWGANLYGQCGLGCMTPKEPVPKLIDTMLGVPIAKIACGSNHTIVLSKSGAVYVWGRNSSGQLGIQDRVNKCYPTHLKSLRNVKICHIDCGENFTVFLTLEGGVFTCGAGEYGQTGHGTTHDELVPKKVIELMGSTVTQIACGRRHFLCRVGERIFACGYGARGQLGCPHMAVSLVPTPVHFTLTEDSPTDSPDGEQPKKRPKKETKANTSKEVPSTSRGNNKKSNGLRDEKRWYQKYNPFKLSKESSYNEGDQYFESVDDKFPDFANEPMKLFAGGDHSFLAHIHDGKIPIDFRETEHSKQILTLNITKLRACERFKDGDIVNLELMAYLETVFASMACINASFLVPNNDHYGCHRNISGVDLKQAEEAFSLISRLENSSIQELIFNHLTSNLIKQVKPSPPDAEALRLFLILPLYHEMRNPRRHVELQGPFAQAFNKLSIHPQKIVSIWYEQQNGEYFEMLVDIFKSVVVYELRQYDKNKKFFTDSVTQILDALTKLNKINFSNPKKPKIPAECFYIEDLCSHVDITTDYISWLSDQNGALPHLCNYAFLFDVQCKSLLLHIDQHLQQHMAVRNEMWTRLVFEPSFEFETLQFLNLTISRDHIVRDTITQISNHDSTQLKKPLRVQFVGEEAEDAGGVKKEFFLLLIKEIFDPVYGMFYQSEETNTIWFSNYPFEDDVMFYLIGAIYALAIYNSIIIYVPFPLVLYKKLLNEPVNLDDLMDISPIMANNLKHLLDYAAEDVEEVFGLCFAVNSKIFDEVHIHPLKEGGESILVTHENKEEYVELYVDFLLNKSVKNQFKAFNRGFQKVCGGRIIKLFQSNELMSVVIGNEEYDWEVFENNAEYKNGYSMNDPQIRWFWEVFHELSLDDKKKFLLFLTGSDRVPIQGMKDIKIRIQPVLDDRYFPVAHTCFNLLDLPRYKTKEKLKYYLQQSIQQTQGFSLV